MQGSCFTLHTCRCRSIEDTVHLTPLHQIATCYELPEHSRSQSLFWCIMAMPSIVVCSGGHSATLADDQTTTGTRAPLRASAHDHSSSAKAYRIRVAEDRCVRSCAA
ncbi:uncharacterized protein ANIA_10995 [Aspergillus nidulans FGSC A4]|uniref:Uncharacterized protein n=1 Tax=Emericella nidulans (strain FGSC A4 / ATCC 38163 / CBS 112.46 / NRRL 194 / M139) TaxID=227321 RepID=C8VC27_EMENI|nr:hypothetical protein [Aspergillus nidulans FGSC A4]CBF79869.1 TPA: hypothetical protein ANIA_10995 [Aspergillus nidulans FGSC A4]